MRARPFILKIAAFLLIIVFSQKAGAGLFIHELFHTDKTSTEFPLQSDGKNQSGYACTCIDDFLMPFVEADEQVCIQPLSVPASPFTSFSDDIPFVATIHSSLRGPPAVMA